MLKNGSGSSPAVFSTAASPAQSLD